jgi:uncharacterized protein (UPF0262 family)
MGLQLTNIEKEVARLSKVNMTFLCNKHGDGSFMLDGKISKVFAGVIFNVDTIRSQLVSSHVAKLPPERTVVWSGNSYFIMEGDKMIAQRTNPFTLNELEKYGAY